MKKNLVFLSIIIFSFNRADAVPLAALPIQNARLVCPTCPAIIHMDQLSSNKPGSPAMHTKWNVSLLNINSGASEYSPAYYKNGLMFSSDRNLLGYASYTGDQKKYSNLYFINNTQDLTSVPVGSLYKKRGAEKRSRSGVSVPYLLSGKNIKPEGNKSDIKISKFPDAINFHYNIGSSSFAGETIYFTRNNSKNGKLVKADDFGYIQDRNGFNGYFSSDRLGSDDIFMFNEIKETGLLPVAKVEP